MGKEWTVAWWTGRVGGGVPAPKGIVIALIESPRGRWGNAGRRSPSGTMVDAVVGADGLLPGKGGLTMLDSEEDDESIVADRVGGGLLLGSGGGASITPTGSVAFLTGSGGLAGVEYVGVDAVDGVASSTWTMGCGLTGRGGAGRRATVCVMGIG